MSDMPRCFICEQDIESGPGMIIVTACERPTSGRGDDITPWDFIFCGITCLRKWALIFNPASEQG